MKVFLIGYMGSGKSKTAETLAKLLKFQWVDIDSQIQIKEGRSISQIFETSGQEYFREIEKKTLHEINLSENIVVSTGGGMPCYFDNMEWMNNNGLTVYLEANAGLLFHRLASMREGRPLIEKLNDVELMEQILSHLIHRIPFYKKAKLIVGAANINVKLLAEKITEFQKK